MSTLPNVSERPQEEHVTVYATPNQNKGINPKQTQIVCPLRACKAKFDPPWNQYVVGVNSEGDDVYQCPVCNGQFTVNNLGVNAVRVNLMKNALFIWYDSVHNKRLFEVHSNAIITNGDSHYVHVPVLVLNNKNARMFSVNDEADTRSVDLALKSACAKKKSTSPDNTAPSARQGEVVFNKVKRPGENAIGYTDPNNV